LRPALPARLAAPLTLLAGAALARTLAAAGAAPRLKWPNDLLLPAGPEMRKAAGSLTDAKPGMRRAAGGLTDAKPGMHRAAGSLTDAKPGMRRAAGSLADAEPGMRKAAGSLTDAEPGMRKAAGILTDAEPGMRKAAGSLTDAKPGMRKAAGILTEMACDGERVRHVVLGVGVDVNQRDFPPELRDRATSLALALGSHQDRGRLLAGFLGELEVLYDGFLAAGPAAALAEWRRFAALPQPCRVRDGDRTVEGTAVDVDDCGALLVRDAAGAVHSVLSGELHR
jgi:biotin-(acetyl-CoA carboxylase) ligase